jgi:hypothetical protein
MKLVADMQQNLVDACAKQTFFVLTIFVDGLVREKK